MYFSMKTYIVELIMWGTSNEDHNKGFHGEIRKDEYFVVEKKPPL